MKTINTLKALAAAIVLTISFNANAIANPVESDSASPAESSYYVTVASRSDNVLAHDYDLWEITLCTGEYYTIVVEGDGDTDLDLYVYDDYGNELDRDDDTTDYCICSVVPRRTGKIKIKVRNLGDVYNHYNLKIYR